ncbi:MAG TPA: phosphopyruvate hydratase [Rhodospirillaceae bacterium]|nr:phosphopyruvate hydratase [Magnetovibrio sp.]HBT42598.1 phosphopyruvate hydratase [Rhodospirillaceae bacterium]HCS71523.1 phosphopyruvate hydratase [Rhodospirillaceae bacterium]|tara:strand:+ start:341 stop:1642 length:1302 start_codon:yes stop_codon:yes gene_type:complete
MTASSATTITAVKARRVWDSRGRPTVEADVTLAGGALGRAIAPAGASRGSNEAIDLRDGGHRFGGWDVTEALKQTNGAIAKTLIGLDATDQAAVDQALIALDGTPNKANLGGNATIAVSMAVLHAAANQSGLPLWKYLWDQGGTPGLPLLPLPEIQIFGGGAHAGRRIDVQDFMVIATGADDYEQALAWTAEVYIAAGKIMAERGVLQGVADEGGFWPAFDANEDAAETLVQAIEKAGLKPGEQVAISLDIAASEFGKGGRYRLAREDRDMSREELAEMLLGWVGRYPIVSVEDPMSEDDAEGFLAFAQAAPKSLQIVGDDFLVTNAGRVQAAARDGALNCALIKPNQAGTVTETKAAFDAARDAGIGAIVSARSGETEDVTIVHLAVGWGAKQLKVGSFTRSERMVKWNEGLRVADAIGSAALPPRAAFPWG